MIKVSDVVADIIARSPIVAEAIETDIANLSKIARRIRPEVESRLLETVSDASIIMALRRLPSLGAEGLQGARFLRRLLNMTVRSGLIEFVFPSSADFARIQRLVLQVTEERKHLFLNVSRGLFSSVIVASAELEEAIDTVLAKEDVKKLSGLASVTLKLPEESLHVPGVYYPILKALAWEGINFVEIISIDTELNIIFTDQVVDQAFSILKRITS